MQVGDSSLVALYDGLQSARQLGFIRSLNASTASFLLQRRPVFPWECIGLSSYVLRQHHLKGTLLFYPDPGFLLLALAHDCEPIRDDIPSHREICNVKWRDRTSGWLVWFAVRNYITPSPLDKIPGPKPKSLLKGNMEQLLHRHGWDFVDELGNKYGKVVRLTGQLGSRVLYVWDPLALHHIFVKDGDSYDLPEWGIDGNYFTLGKSMVSVHAPAHRRQRKMINAVFSIKHMRSVTPLFYSVAHKLRVGLNADVGDTPTEVDILNWFGRTALELIGQGGLGYSLDPLDRPGRTEYGDVMKQFLPLLFLNGHWIQSVLKYVKHIGTPSFRAAAIDWLPIPELRELKKVTMRMDEEAMKIYQMKKNNLEGGEETMIKQVGEGKDIMSHMLRANKVASDEERLEEAEIMGQMSLLVLAGVDTTSNGMTQLMLLLSEYPAIQEKMRSEIRQAQGQHGEDIPYDTLVALPYMDAVCRESLRLYPPGAFVYRESQKDIVLPLSESITGIDGTLIKEIPVPAGTTFVAGIQAINCSKEIWGEDALEFKPERWLSPLPSSVNDAHIPGVYSNLMTFTGGRRSCIGFKFAQLEMKVLLTIILSSFKVSYAKESKDVVWNLASVRYPTVGKESTLPSCPITLERIRD